MQNKVIRAVKQAKSKYFESQVNHLKNSKPRKWWSSIKNLAGYSPKAAFRSAEVNGSILQGCDLATAINNGFLAATESLPPLSSTDKLPVNELTVAYSISIVDVESRLKAVKSNKAPGPDLLPNWILNNYSMEISEPVTMIFNTSIKQAQGSNAMERSKCRSCSEDIPSHGYIHRFKTYIPDCYALKSS